MSSARDGDLDEPRAAAVLGMAFEQVVDPSKAVRDSLGVVQALDPHADQIVILDVQLFAPAFHGGFDLPAPGLLVVGLEIDADREWPHQSRMTAPVHLVPIVVNPCFDLAVDRIQEVLAVVMNVEAEQVVAQQSVKQLFSPREGPEDLAIGPGNVPELGNDQTRMLRS